jgi:hypothetical protein
MVMRRLRTSDNPGQNGMGAPGTIAETHWAGPGGGLVSTGYRLNIDSANRRNRRRRDGILSRIYPLHRF